MQKDKVETLIGFMVKAGKLVYGKDALESYRKKIHLIVVCSTASKNTIEALLNIAPKKNSKLILTQKPLEQIVHKPNCKVIAITNAQAAKAIISYINESYKLLID